MIALNAYAKLNLSLAVTGKREDGYHELDSIMQSISLCDTVTIELADSLNVSMDIPGINEESNTAFAAARAFFSHTGIAQGATIRIQKRIPSMAGLGGASADAAAVLTGLNLLYHTKLNAAALAAIGVTLGADVPFALQGGMARAKGIGEILKPLYPKSKLHFVVVKPMQGVSTAEAFRRYKTSSAVRIDTVEYALLKGDMDLFWRYAGNALGIPALGIAPEMMQAAGALMQAGAGKSLMSGSGSSMFSVLPTIGDALAAAARVRGSFELCGAYSAVETGVDIIQDGSLI